MKVARDKQETSRFGRWKPGF